MKPTKLQSAMKASFRSDKQWKLQQIQDAYNSMREANRLLKTLHDEKAPLESLIDIVEDIIVHLQRCQNRLVAPNLLSLNGLVNSVLSKMFVPPLPGDMLVNMFVLEDHVVVVLYTVQQAPTNASLNASKGGKLHHNQHKSDRKQLFHPAGSIIEYAGAQYEVAAVNRAEMHISSITNLLQAASTAQMLFQTLLNMMKHLSNN